MKKQTSQTEYLFAKMKVDNGTKSSLININEDFTEREQGSFDAHSTETKGTLGFSGHIMHPGSVGKRTNIICSKHLEIG